MRNSILQRPEAQDTGSIILTGFEPEIVLSSVRTVIEEYKSQVTNHKSPRDYQVTDTSWRVLKFILGNAGLSNRWWGINE